MGRPYKAAEVQGARGEVDAALEWLERAYAQRDGGLAEMKPSPRFLTLPKGSHLCGARARIGLTAE